MRAAAAGALSSRLESGRTGQSKASNSEAGGKPRSKEQRLTDFGQSGTESKAEEGGNSSKEEAGTTLEERVGTVKCG